jgi:YVTN family beta-propeller protein
MDFRILGPLEVLDEGRVLDVGGGKQRSVFALLLLHANEVVPSDRLIDELWPDEPPPTATKIVQAHVSRLRKALDGAGERILVTRGQGYELRVAQGQLDLERFRDLLESGRSALAADDPEKAAETLRTALALWRGPPLADFAYDSFAQESIARFEELRLSALEERIDADLALGRHDAVVQELEQLVARHPLRERLRGQLMLALYRSGRQAEALEVYRDGRRRLADELGLEPGPSLQQLERAILAHDAALQPATRKSKHGRTRRKGGLLIAAGSSILIAAAVGVAVIELTGNDKSTGLAAVAADRVGVIDPHTNRIVGQIPVGSEPTQIAFGRDGVWVVSRHDNTVTRIDPKTRTQLRTIAVGGPPIAIADGENAVWALVSADPALDNGPARVVRIDPATNDVLRRISIGTGSFAFSSRGSVAAENGVLWVVNPEERLTIAKVDAETNTVRKTFTAGAPTLSFNTGTAGGIAGGSGLAFGYGAIWAGTDLGVVRINAGSDSVSASFQLDVSVPTGVAVGENAVWVVARPAFHCCPAKTVGIGTLTRIDPTTNSIKEKLPIGGDPVAVAVGEGSVWIADAGRRAVLRVDPDSMQVIKRIRTGARPRGIAIGDGVVWISAG